MANIGFISTRFAVQDGVSRESAKWAEKELLQILDDQKGKQASIFQRYLDMLDHWVGHPPFHPFARQEILGVGHAVFGLVREARKGSQRITYLFNFTDEVQLINASAVGGNVSRLDLLSGETVEAG